MDGALVPQPAIIEMTIAVPGSWRRVDRRFYIGAALFIILLSIAGFAPSLVDQSGRNAPITPLVTAHGIAAGAWLLLFLAQATLVATRRTTIHRRLGIISTVLAVAMILLGYMVTIQSGRRGHDLSGDVIRALSRTGRPFSPAGLLFPLAELFNFGALVGAGLWFRHRPDIHRRLMLFATVTLANEPILHLVGHLAGHWPNLRGAGITFSVPVTILLLSASGIYDRVSQRHIHPVSLWVPILLFAWQHVILVFVVFRSALWREFAARLISVTYGF
jgi:hypothetical protein